MIGSLRGTLRERTAGRVIVDVAGVGYVVHVPMSTFLELPVEGSEVDLLVDTQVREDSITLYGFREAAERDVFERLLTVAGVGPRIALAALSSLGPEAVASSIRNGDARTLSSVPGIGRKTAERLIVDLRDRIGTPARGARPAGPRVGHEADDVVSALVNLGYAERQASRAVSEALEDPEAKTPRTFEGVLRLALRQLSRG